MGQQALRGDIVRQIDQERERKQRKSNFQFNNVARHNPITNPIEYHIDNPYILKEMQSKNSYKSHSMYQSSPVRQWAYKCLTLWVYLDVCFTL